MKTVYKHNMCLWNDDLMIMITMHSYHNHDDIKNIRIFVITLTMTMMIMVSGYHE